MYSNPKSLVNFLLSPLLIRGGLGCGTKFTTPARIAIWGDLQSLSLHGNSPYLYSNYATPKSPRKLNGEIPSLCSACFWRKLRSHSSPKYLFVVFLRNVKNNIFLFKIQIMLKVQASLYIRGYINLQIENC